MARPIRSRWSNSIEQDLPGGLDLFPCSPDDRNLHPTIVPIKARPVNHQIQLDDLWLLVIVFDASRSTNSNYQSEPTLAVISSSESSTCKASPALGTSQMNGKGLALKRLTILANFAQLPRIPMRNLSEIVVAKSSSYPRGALNCSDLGEICLSRLIL